MVKGYAIIVKTRNSLKFSVSVLLCLLLIGCSSQETEIPVAGKTYVLRYNPEHTGILSDADQISVVYAFDYWGTKVVQRLRGEGEQEDLFHNVLNPDEGRSIVRKMDRRGDHWEANIPIPDDASLISYYFTDGVRNDYNERKTYVSYVYGEDGKPVKGARFRNIDFLLMAGKDHPAILDEIRKEITDYPDHFIAHVVYWRFQFFETVSPDTLMKLMEKSGRHFSNLHNEYGDTVLNYKVLSLNDFNRIMRLSLREKFDDPSVTELREVVNSTILRTINELPQEQRLEQLRHIESIAKMMLQTPSQRVEREIESMEKLMERLAERIEKSKVQLQEMAEPAAGQDVFYLAVEEMPEIIGGIGSIQQRIRYPEEAKDAGIEGTVYVHVFIDTEGNVAKTEVVRDPGGGLAGAAVKAVTLTQFKPGRQRGEPVPVRVSIPIHFRLAEPEIDSKETAITIVEGPADLGDYITYPEDAIKNEIEGEVHTTVTLDENAHIIGIWIESGSDEKIARATMEGILKYPFADRETYRDLQKEQTITIIVRFSIQ